MAKTSGIAFVLCIASLLSLTSATEDRFFVEGKVYCDTCRVQFETRITEYLQGAKVTLECRNREEGHLTYSQEASTDESGDYKIQVEGDHEEDICEVKLTKSPRDDCNEVSSETQKARVLLTENNGVAEPIRFASPLGFLKKEANADCAEVLREMGFIPEI